MSSPQSNGIIRDTSRLGTRTGELTELRKKDIDWTSGVLTVSRVVIEFTKTFAQDGRRFVVKPYPKDDEWRRITLSGHVLGLLREHAARLSEEDLLFEVRQPEGPRRRRPEVLPDPAKLRLTEPNERGKRYQHGTITAYSMAPCRCRHCQDAYAAYAAYRAERRAAGKDEPRVLKTLDTDGHIPFEMRDSAHLQSASGTRTKRPSSAAGQHARTGTGARSIGPMLAEPDAARVSTRS